MSRFSTRQSDISLNKLHAEFKEAYANISETNWTQQIISYLGQTLAFSGDNANYRMITGWVAALCERAYYVTCYRKQLSIRINFEHQLHEIVHSIRLPQFLTRPGSVVCGKRQPSFVESIVPTLERFQVMERLPEVFGEGVDAIIIGGSMSYAPFFNVRGDIKNNDVSDIDALGIINDRFFELSSWRNFLEDDIFPLTEKETFISRINTFQELWQKRMAEVFSQRFSISGKSFTVSPHFLPFSIFENMVHTDLKESLRSRRDEAYILRSFKTEIFTHPCHARHTFDGQRIESIIDGYESSPGVFISSMPGYIVSHGDFYPGVYHTVISPAFLVYSDRNGKTTDLVKTFENILYQEVECARKKGAGASYAKAHNRYDVFAPGRFDGGLNSFLTPEGTKNYNSHETLTFAKVESPGSPIMGEEMAEYSEQNEYARSNAKQMLELWKKETLADAENEIGNFIEQKSFDVYMRLAKSQNLRWYTVTTIAGKKNIIVNLPNPYRQNNLSSAFICEELYTQRIGPSDIMSLDAYEKLTRKTGKVYVASIMDPATESGGAPLHYGLVIAVK